MIKVNSEYRKESKVIAECSVEEKIPEELYSFTTTPEDLGHRDLCHFLEKNRIKGSYREWLKAVEDGDEQSADEKRHLSVICFECDPIEEEKATGWNIKLREGFMEKEINL